MGLFHAFAVLSHNFALDLASVPAVVAIKRTSVVFSVVWGIVILHELGFRERLSGSVLMILGAGLVGFGESQ